MNYLVKYNFKNLRNIMLKNIFFLLFFTIFHLVAFYMAIVVFDSLAVIPVSLFSFFLILILFVLNVRLIVYYFYGLFNEKVEYDLNSLFDFKYSNRDEYADIIVYRTRSSLKGIKNLLITFSVAVIVLSFV